MNLNTSTVQSLRRVFQQAFVVYDIAEPLISFDDTCQAKELRAHMESKRFEVVGIRHEGRVVGYAELRDLKDSVTDAIKRFDDSQVILESMPLADLILKLRNHQRLFVSILGQVGGIVSRTDLQKPPVRMWLFGIVTLIEMRFTRMIERHCLDESWKEYLSAGRIKKSEELLAERIRRNQDLGLLDCLQFSDKVQVIARNEKLRNLTRFESRRKVEEAAKVIEKLRNNLAHSQDIIVNDWEAIVALAERLDIVLEGPPGLDNEGEP
ncbi:hypothetical protein [Thalassoroseus pseudoceratinae]|uniref:hypothetical protein n=1 Tax=Thalassoroseus pseudoceratinae TaxID=2713176 RepID=UPI00141ECE3C|nr:hypothetical protein [Thalassoroseus pseudoceratinae]